MLRRKLSIQGVDRAWLQIARRRRRARRSDLDQTLRSFRRASSFRCRRVPGGGGRRIAHDIAIEPVKRRVSWYVTARAMGAGHGISIGWHGQDHNRSGRESRTLHASAARRQWQCHLARRYRVGTIYRSSRRDAGRFLCRDRARACQAEHKGYRQMLDHGRR